LDKAVYAFRLGWNGESRELGFRTVRGLRRDGAKTASQRIRNLPSIARYPDARAVDATSAAVDGNALSHEVKVVFPTVRAVIADQNFAETRSVDLHTRIAGVLLHSGRAAED